VAVALERRVEVRAPIAAALHLPSVADSEPCRSLEEVQVPVYGLRGTTRGAL